MPFDAGEIEGTLTLDRDPFQEGLAQAQRDAGAWARQKFTATLDADTDPLLAKIAALKDALDGLTARVDTDFDPTDMLAEIEALKEAISALGDVDLGSNFDDLDTLGKVEALRAALEELRDTYTAQADVDAAPAETSLGALDARLDAYQRSHPTATLDLDTGPALASLGFFQSALGALTSPMGISRDVLAGAASGGTGGGGRDSLATMIMGDESRSFLARALSPATMLGTLFSAQFGSLGSLAGFGPEHLVTTGLGIGGLGVGAAMGGGILAASSLTRSAVGGGSDSLVSHETLSNVQALIDGTTTLTALIAKVGPTAAVAEDQLSNSWQAMTADFSMATSGAQVEVSQIGEQFVKLAGTYIPLIASAAERNFGIIKTAIQPLMSWLEGPSGTGIFQSLENQFASQLPATISIATNAFEIFMKVMDYASQFTGSFTNKLAADFARWNTPTGMTKIDAEVRKLIGDFHIVTGFLSAFGKVIIDVFKNDAGTATAVIEKMTAGLQQLDRWIKSAAGSDALKNLFNVHRGETIQLMEALGKALVSFGAVYIKIAPYFVELVTDVLRLANAFYDFTQKIPGLAQLADVGIALLIFEARAKTVTNTMRILRSVWNLPGDIAGALREANIAITNALIGIKRLTVAVLQNLAALGEWAAGLVGVTFESDLLNLALGVGVIGAIAALGFGIYELIKHFGVLRGIMIAAIPAIAAVGLALWSLDADPVVLAVSLIVIALAGLVAAAIWVAKNWTQVWHDVTTFMRSDLALIIAGIALLVAPLLAIPFVAAVVVAHWKTIWGGLLVALHVLESAWDSVWSAMVRVIHDVSPAFDVVVGIIRLGFDIVTSGALILREVWDVVWAAITGAISIAGAVISVVIQAIRTAMTPVEVGVQILEALWRLAWSLITAAVQLAWSVIDDVIELIVDVGLGMLRSGVNALEVAWSAAWNAVHAAVSAAWSVVGPIFTAIVSDGINGIVSGIRTLQSIWDSVWHDVASVISSVAGGIESVLNGIAGAVSTVANGLHDLTNLASTVGSGVGGTISKLGALIPHFAEGGVVMGPTLALIGERGPELVLPMSGSGITLSAISGSKVAPLTASSVSKALGASSVAVPSSVVQGSSSNTSQTVFAPTTNVTVSGAGSPQQVAALVGQEVEKAQQKLVNKLYALEPR